MPPVPRSAAAKRPRALSDAESVLPAWRTMKRVSCGLQMVIAHQRSSPLTMAMGWTPGAAGVSRPFRSRSLMISEGAYDLDSEAPDRLGWTHPPLVPAASNCR